MNKIPSIAATIVGTFLTAVSFPDTSGADPESNVPHGEEIVIRNIANTVLERFGFGKSRPVRIIGYDDLPEGLCDAIGGCDRNIPMPLFRVGALVIPDEGVNYDDPRLVDALVAIIVVDYMKLPLAIMDTMKLINIRNNLKKAMRNRLSVAT